MSRGMQVLILLVLLVIAGLLAYDRYEKEQMKIAVADAANAAEAALMKPCADATAEIKKDRPSGNRVRYIRHSVGLNARMTYSFLDSNKEQIGDEHSVWMPPQCDPDKVLADAGWGD